MTGTFSSDVLNPLVRGTDLERGQARAALVEILEGQVEGVLIASFLTALTAKGETADEMTGFIDAMIESASTFSIGPDAMDIVGTGGDQLHTVNVSTMAALAVAGCGVPVAKHGNRAASSSVGSADLLEALGVRLDAPADVVRACVEGAGIGFMFAPMFHHGLGYLTPIRRALGFRTIFNVLGPLANPALVRRTLIGVAQAPLLDSMTQVLVARGIDHAILVNADDGLDELSLGASSTLHVIDVQRRRRPATSTPGRVLGLRHERRRLSAAATPRTTWRSREVSWRAVRGRSSTWSVPTRRWRSLSPVARRHLSEGFELATASVTEGRAGVALERLVELSNS